MPRTRSDDRTVPRPSDPVADGAAAPRPAPPAEADVPARVREVLTGYLAARRAEAHDTEPAFATAVVDTLSGFIHQGGKRLRPTLAWWGWRAAGGAAEGPAADAALRAASALELLQTFALVHDDVMDGSSTRRGAPAVHVAFAGAHRAHGWTGDPGRYGAGLAILVGDLALAWADDLLSEAGLPPAALARARVPWRAMRTEMVAGQYLDVQKQAEGDDSEELTLRIARLKTAAYTVERPLHLGAAMAGAGEAAVAALRGYGADVGVAFQLRDDVLGMFGDPARTGKPAGDDLREGKRTYLIAMGLRRAREAGDHAAHALISSALGDPGADGATVARVRAALTELGAADAVERRIAELTRRGLDRLDSPGIEPAAAEQLRGLARRATERTR
ncbi:polyprenyl synthetase family protein [Allonocardiopsis opalescens]|uniref:polyprenyl synthetase family protein n=1 Tax=Allonocardiopsis opalescens TaxID=1144618 RepID=UPI001FEAB26D|nr:polyprenyl synthetase family protein [Allonocardiopsis opalescens]